MTSDFIVMVLLKNKWIHISFPKSKPTNRIAHRMKTKHFFSESPHNNHEMVSCEGFLLIAKQVSLPSSVQTIMPPVLAWHLVRAYRNSSITVQRMWAISIILYVTLKKSFFFIIIFI